MRYFWLVLFLIPFNVKLSGKVYAQKRDTVLTTIPDSAEPHRKKHPGARKAAIRSAILPGWGQFYNRKYWKIPILYAGGSIISYLLINNNNQYIHYKDLAKANPLNSQYSYERDQYHQQRDWSIAFLIGLYILNIVDASVDAHLKEFDVGENLSFHLKPYLYRNQFMTQPVTGLSLNIKLKK